MTVIDTEHTYGNDDPDVALMLAFQRGHEEAFVQLYRRHRDRIVNYARRLLGSNAEGEEAAQEVFLKLYSAKARYRPQSRFSTFLYRIATNHCLNLKARHERTLRAAGVEVETQQTPNAASPESRAQVGELRAAIQRALAAVPDKQAAAFMLCHFEGMSCRDAAEVLDVSESALKALIYRARDGLARELAGAMDEKLGVPHAVP